MLKQEKANEKKTLNNGYKKNSKLKATIKKTLRILRRKYVWLLLLLFFLCVHIFIYFTKKNTHRIHTFFIKKKHKPVKPFFLLRLLFFCVYFPHFSNFSSFVACLAVFCMWLLFLLLYLCYMFTLSLM